ncbi:hypothetical protein DENSPDRAFT_928642 [Dentipellis sp. KUC8613]|nr:hypothetical protein DENSPDRAFT_928642 [Dentipellis sp. KUC8613]
MSPQSSQSQLAPEAFTQFDLDRLERQEEFNVNSQKAEEEVFIYVWLNGEQEANIFIEQNYTWPYLVLKEHRFWQMGFRTSPPSIYRVEHDIWAAPLDWELVVDVSQCRHILFRSEEAGEITPPDMDKIKGIALRAWADGMPPCRTWSEERSLSRLGPRDFLSPSPSSSRSSSLSPAHISASPTPDMNSTSSHGLGLGTAGLTEKPAEVIVFRKIWPRDYFVVDVGELFRTCDLASRKGEKIETVFHAMFGPDVRFVKSTFYDHRGRWERAPEAARRRYLNLGRSAGGLWSAFAREFPSRDSQLRTERRRAGQQPYN